MERFSASVANKHMNCHASANLELAIPNWVPPERDPLADNAANRGTQMHELFAQIMAMPAKDGMNIAKAVAYVAAIRATRRFKVLIEQQVTIDWLVSKPTTRADLVLYVADELHVFDLKTGKIPVGPVENAQLLYYACAYGELAPKAKGAYLHIVQPWADVVDAWYADAARLQAFMNEAKQAEQAILQGSTRFNPGDHCMFCPANPHSRSAKGRPLCPAMRDLLYPQPPVNYAEMMGEG